MTPELLDHYRATTYAADTPRGRIAIRIDRPCPELDALLAERALRRWAFISAHNPHSRQLPEPENARRHAALLRASARWAAFEGEGTADAGDWRERSLLLLGIGPAEAIRLGKRFGQNAIVVGARGEPARLILLTGRRAGPGAP